MYHKKTNTLISERIDKNIIKNNKIYNHKKLIRILDLIIKNNKINNGLLKTNFKILINKDFSPSDIFIVKYVFNALETIKYTLLKEEDLIKEKQVIIIWNDYINFVNKNVFSNIKNIELYQKMIKKNDYIIVGISENFEEIKRKLQDIFKIRVFEYENSDIILFDRA